MLTLVDISASVWKATVRNVAAAAINLTMPLRQQQDASMSNANIIGWYINEWLAYQDLSQVDLCRLTGWKKAKVSAFCTGRSAYTRDIIDKCASVMGIHPNELLLHPQRAIQLRRLEAVKHEFLGRESDN